MVSISTAAKVPLNERCSFGDMCVDINARCLGGVCQCHGEFSILGGRCGTAVNSTDFQF